MRATELVQRSGTFDAESCLLCSGRVVDAGMNHLAVVSARSHARSRLPLQYADGVAPSGNRPRCSEAYDTAADYGSIYA
jgi:hypothetical protein